MSSVGAARRSPKERRKVLRGKNGRLFLDNDTNRVIKQHTGELLFSDRQLRDWQLVLENRVAWLDKLGIPYFFLVPPNSHSVYPEDLPEGFRAGPLRPVQQLIGYLEDQRSFARLIYPLDELLAAKPNPLLYAKTDPHWTAQGAFVAYRRLAGEIRSVLPVHQVTEQDVSFHEHLSAGELGSKLDPPEESVHLSAVVPRPQAWLVSDNLIRYTGMRVVTECPEAPPTSCLVLGDSYSRQMLPFLAASFRRLVFGWVTTLDRDLVREERPDVVVGVLNERFLIRVPNDVTGPTTREFERERKLDARVGEELRQWPKRTDLEASA